MEKDDKKIKKEETPNSKEVEKEEKEKQNISLEKQIRSENDTLKKFFIGIGVFILVLVGIIWGISSMNYFEYKGVKFIKENFCDAKPCLIFYRTSFPVIYKDEMTGKAISADYNFYIRNDPRELEEEVPFNGKMILLDNMVINATDDFNCNGDGVIAIANLLKLSLFNMKIIRDENATCDSLGRYTFLQIEEGNDTMIQQFGPSCYRITVNNCEILKATERFMVESFVNAQEKLIK